MSVNKNGIISVNMSDYALLVPNFVEKKNAAGWSLGTPTYNTGYTQLSGSSPSLTSPTFNVGEYDIIVVEISVSLPTPSTTTSGPGIYIGTKYGQDTMLYDFNFSNNSWSAGSSSTNPYFLNSYNSTNTITFKSYILGKSVEINNAYQAYRSQTTHGIRAIKLTSDTTTCIRAGYNSNSSMLINIYDIKIYSKHGLCESSNILQIGKGFVDCSNLIEY